MDASDLLGDGASSIAALPPGADASIIDHVGGVKTASAARRVAAQAYALSAKNLLILRGRKRSSLAYVLMPSLGILLLWALEIGVTSWLSPPPPEDTALLPLRVRKCAVFDRLNLPTDAPCTTAMFAPDSPNAVAIMRKFAAATGLEYGVDVVGVSSAKVVSDTIAHAPGSVDAAVIFAAPESTVAPPPPPADELPEGWESALDASGSMYYWRTDAPGELTWTRPELPQSSDTEYTLTYDDPAWAPAGPGVAAPKLTYELWTNTTGDMGRWLTGDDRHLIDRAAVYGHYEAVIQAVDAAIIGHVGGLPASADVLLDVGRFAELDFAGSGVHVDAAAVTEAMTATFADVTLVLGNSFTALMVLYTIASEKEARMLAALRTVGLREWLFWSSWGLSYSVLGILAAALATTLGSVLNMRVFVQCAWSVQFLAVMLFMQSFGGLAIFISSFVTRGRYIIAVAMILLMVVFVGTYCIKILELIAAGTDSQSLAARNLMAYGPDQNLFIWLVLSIQPWYHYLRLEMAIVAKIYPDLDISTVDSFATKSVDDTYFHYSDLDGHPFGREGSFQSTSSDYRGTLNKSDREEYTLGTSLWAQVFLSMFYYALAWYFGQVKSSDEGSHESCCFCFSPNYWGLTRKPVLVMDDDDTIGLEKSKSRLEQSVRCYKLSKAYKEEMAVSELTLAIESSSCLALLGTNGAGKSTLVKALTGVHTPTHGEGFIFGLDIREDMPKLQSIMGVCPQEDLLWSELTAREHLHIYARFKGIVEGAIEQHCLSILTAVGLLAEADNRVSTYSGGMKRRLSVGVASVASPRIIFLDEPSTGMDPLSKRRVWTMIEQLKKGRVTLLTTHSMEEADALGDKVAILDRGRLRASGSSLFLKRTYGKGHTVTLLSEPDSVSRVEELVKASMPSAEILGSDSGNTSVSIKRSAIQGIPRLFSSLMAEEGLIQEWGLSDTTLEEVFLRLAAQNHEVNSAIEGDNSDDIGRVMLVRTSDSATQERVCVLEAAKPSTIVVVEPETSGLEIVPMPEEPAESTDNGDNERITMDELVMPSNNHTQDAARRFDTQLVDMVVPLDSSPGQEVYIEIRGSRIVVQVPLEAEPGQRIQIPVPLPPRSGSGRLGLDEIMSRDQVKPVGLAEQTYAIVWKNIVLAFGCRNTKASSNKRCLYSMNCKCFELCFYISLFMIMAAVAVLHTVVVTFIDQNSGGYSPDMFCEDGVVHVILEKGHAWEHQKAEGQYGRSYGSYCGYTNDGQCDEPYLCPVGSDSIDCRTNTVQHATQFSSCNRTAVSEEMLGLAARALVRPPPLDDSCVWANDGTCDSDWACDPGTDDSDCLQVQTSHRWTASCDESARNLQGGSCWTDLVRSSVTELYKPERPPDDYYGDYYGGSYHPGGYSSVYSGHESCTQARIHANTSCANGLGLDGACLPAADIWFSDASAPGSTSLAELSLFPGASVSWADNSAGLPFECPFIHDGQCDESTGSSGTGLCVRGSDHADCQSDSHYYSQDERDIFHGIATRFREIEMGQVNALILQAQKYNRDQKSNRAECDGVDVDLVGTRGDPLCPGILMAENAYEYNTWLPENATTGTIASGQYSNNAACQWVVTCPVGSTVQLHFITFETESAYDYVDIWDRGGDSIPAGGTGDLGRYDGVYTISTLLPPPVTSTGRFMTIRLLSDASATRSGFTAEYRCSGSFTDQLPAEVHYSSVDQNTQGSDFNSYQPSDQAQFLTAAAADAFYRNSFPAFAIEVSKSQVRTGQATLHYGVRMWSSHHYQGFPHLRSMAHGCDGQTCTIQRQVDTVSDASRADGVERGISETREDKQLRKIINAMSNSVMRTVVGPGASISNTEVPMPEFTYWASRREAGEGLALWMIMYPLLTMLLIPSQIAMLASEKENGLLAMIKMEGGRNDSLFLGNWAFVFGYTFAFAGLFVLTMEFSGATDGDTAVNMPAWPVFKLLLLWAHAQTGFVHFIGLVTFKKARHGALFGAFAVIISTLCGWIITVAEAEHALTSAPLPTIYLLIPPVAYTRTVGVLLWYGGGDEFGRGCWMLALDGVLYFGLAVGYSLCPEGFGRMVFLYVRPESAPELLEMEVVSTGGGTPIAAKDESVTAERERATGTGPANAAILIQGLVKDYNKVVSNGKVVTKRVLNELYLAVQTGEVFGLLGPNGAGKTTTLSVLTGSVTATSGTASVSGFDISTDMETVKRVIGVCPQFDVLYEDMSVRQHLVFYSLLRGLPRSRVDVEARRLAEKMELDGDMFNKLVSTLPGGAKRRLSIAIALAGKPPVLFFDEPTTGLDPETRRQIWNIIKAEQASNCIVITTHSMEEADALCSRIGIMAGGSLRAVGSQLELKSRFGDGFKVSLNCVDDSTERLTRVHEFIVSLSADAQFVSRFGPHLTFTVPLAGGDVATIFNRMEGKKRELGILEWGVTQSSLEEVFVKVVMAHEEEVHGQSSRNMWANPLSDEAKAGSDEEES